MPDHHLKLIVAATSEADAVAALAAYTAAGFADEDLPMRHAAAIVSCAAHCPTSHTYAERAHALIQSKLNQPDKPERLDIFVGTVATFYKRYGNAANLVQLMDVVQADDKCNMTAPFIRQFGVALAHHSIEMALELCIKATSDTELSAVFQHVLPRKSELAVANWDECSGSLKVAIVLSNIVISACADRASQAQLMASSPSAVPMLLAILRHVATLGVPMTEETCGRAILSFAAPIHLYYKKGSTNAHIFGAVVEHLGHVPIMSNEGGSWIGNALIRLAGQVDDEFGRLWRILTCMCHYGFVDHNSRHGDTSRALKIATRSICLRLWPSKGSQIYSSRFQPKILSEFDAYCGRSGQPTHPTTVLEFMKSTERVHAPFGTPIGWR